MKLTVKTLKGTRFDIPAQPTDTIMAVKKTIEEALGKDSYPWGRQLLIHNGKVLKDESTLEENEVSEDRFLVVMLSKSKTSGTGAATSAQPSATAAVPHPAPMEASTQAPASSTTAAERANPEVSADSYDQVAGSNLEQMVNQLMEIGGGNWDRDTVLHALHAAYNNPERAAEYLNSGIPATAEVAVPVDLSPSSQTSFQAANTTEATTAGTPPISGVPNSSPLNMFPQGLDVGAGGGSLDFLRTNRVFLALRATVQANPRILQMMLQELSMQNPQLLRLIQQHHAEFLQLINEPIEGGEGDLFNEPEDDMHHAISATPEEEEAIGRLEAMGFDRARAIEAFLACDRNEQMAANYLLEHAGDED